MGHDSAGVVRMVKREGGSVRRPARSEREESRGRLSLGSPCGVAGGIDAECDDS